MSARAPLIERIARAIYEGRNGHGCKPWGRQPASHKAPYQADALAALKAMRRPEINSAVIDAMNDVWVDAIEFQINVSMADCQTLFTAAIDAAIQEHSTSSHDCATASGQNAGDKSGHQSDLRPARVGNESAERSFDTSSAAIQEHSTTPPETTGAS